MAKQKLLGVSAEDAFALRIHGDSMVDSAGGMSFPDGCIIVVDPTAAAKAMPGDHVVVRLRGAREVFRTLEQGDGALMLRTLNPRYPSVPLPADAKIVGVVVQKITPTPTLDRPGRVLDRGRERRAALA